MEPYNMKVEKKQGGTPLKLRPDPPQWSATAVPYAEGANLTQLIFDCRFLYLTNRNFLLDGNNLHRQ
jgi:hypothetical protein